jgi:hypothetical protein
MSTSSMSSRALLLALCCMASSIADAAPAEVDAFAQPALLGMQLAAKQWASRGAISAGQLSCVQRLVPSDLYQVVEESIASALTPQERAEANRFFDTSVGQKYLKHGLLQIYSAVGDKAPEPLPTFSGSEYKEVATFASTSAGQALITRQVMQSASAKQALNDRTRELMEQCRAR